MGRETTIGLKEMVEAVQPLLTPIFNADGETRAYEAIIALLRRLDPDDPECVDKLAHRLMPLMFDGTDLLDATPSGHSGDCTKEAHTCLLCQFTEARQGARATLRALTGEAGS